MYESFFQFNGRPFAAVPDPRRYFAAACIEESRQSLSRGIERAEGPGLIVGPAGTGKSLLCQVLASQFRSRFDVVMLSSARLCTRRALLQNILFELNLPYRDREEGELRLSLIDHLEPGPRCPQGMLLIVDEAHTLPLRLLEEVRLITNLVREGQTRVRLVLAGGSRLEERFTHPKLESFNQRLAVRCYLQPMSRLETADYVRFQIERVGGRAERIFEASALESVFQATDGIPRLVNQVCDHGLMLACQRGRGVLAAEDIEMAWADLQRLPTPWTAPVEEAQQAAVVEFGQLADDPPSRDRVASGSEAPSADADESRNGLRANLSADWDNGTEAEVAPLREPVVEPVAEPVAEPVNERANKQELKARREPDTTSSTNGTTVPLRIADCEDEPSVADYPLLHFQSSAARRGDPSDRQSDERALAKRSEGSAGQDRDPFGEFFEEEEVVVDRYAALDASLPTPAKIPLLDVPGFTAALGIGGSGAASKSSGTRHVVTPTPAKVAEEKKGALGASNDLPGGSESTSRAAAEFLNEVPSPQAAAESTGGDESLQVLEFAQPQYREPASATGKPWEASSLDAPVQPTIALPPGGHVPVEDTLSHDDDCDMIVVAPEAEQRPRTSSAPAASRVKRRDYRQLFAQLRRPSS